MINFPLFMAGYVGGEFGEFMANDLAVRGQDGRQVAVEDPGGGVGRGGGLGNSIYPSRDPAAAVADPGGGVGRGGGGLGRQYYPSRSGPRALLPPPRIGDRGQEGRGVTFEPIPDVPMPQGLIDTIVANIGRNLPLPLLGGGGNQVGPVPEDKEPKRFYPGNDALSLLSDLFLRTFGGDTSTASPAQYSVVPQVVSPGSKGNSSIILLFVLGAAGFGIYWFYFRKKKGGD